MTKRKTMGIRIQQPTLKRWRREGSRPGNDRCPWAHTTFYSTENTLINKQVDAASAPLAPAHTPPPATASTPLLTPHELQPPRRLTPTNNLPGHQPATTDTPRPIQASTEPQSPEAAARRPLNGLVSSRHVSPVLLLPQSSLHLPLPSTHPYIHSPLHRRTRSGAPHSRHKPSFSATNPRAGGAAHSSYHTGQTQSQNPAHRPFLTQHQTTNHTCGNPLYLDRPVEPRPKAQAPTPNPAQSH
eukprot:XP_011678932.1 PREDICTED: proline-rich receptor-like protein kinase PERK2 [Strongylocentrotus purpuratus]